MVASKMIKKGTSFRLSKIGHNNFQYPDDKNTYQLKNDMMGDSISWMSFSGLRACIIPQEDLESEISDLQVILESGRAEQQKKKYSVIWIDDDNDFFKSESINSMQ